MNKIYDTVYFATQTEAYPAIHCILGCLKSQSKDAAAIRAKKKDHYPNNGLA
ncbi:MAG: hypothetical protein H7199_06105 [Burkholderiales bacterium]|nr:hypothetical protein [Flavobacterium sp.]